MGEDSKALGNALQLARQQAGYTQQQLCNSAGLSYSTLAKIERGAIKTPSVFTVARIANVLNISMDNLMGAVVDTGKLSPSVNTQKKTSRNGVKFLYLDINGCLVRFFQGAFTKISHETSVPSDVIESTFWHFNDAVCRGEITMDEFNARLAHRFGLPTMNFIKYYMESIESIDETFNLLTWASEHFKVGLLSNIMPGFIDEMIRIGKLPNISYDAIVDSSVVHSIKPEVEIYETAQKLAGVSPEEILFVDDSRTNLMAAERFGWKVLWFDDYRPEQSVKKIKSSLEI